MINSKFNIAGNGFIEGKELEKFLKDFFVAEQGAQGVSIWLEYTPLLLKASFQRVVFGIPIY